MSWADAAAALALIGLTAYAILGGADFGGGIWDLFATGPRKREQREAIAHAMGPVWEANHVWLIFVIVLLFTCFPKGYSALMVALFVPAHLALLGIMARGAAFVFKGFSAAKPARGAVAPQQVAPAERSPGRATRRPAGETRGTWGWGLTFGVASVVAPLALGAAFGAITSGSAAAAPGGGTTVESAAWSSPYALGCAALALSACAYLAAVFMMNETDGELREDFRRRAVVAGTATAALAGLVLVLAYFEANWFFHRLLSPRAAPILAAGLVCFGASAWAVFTARPWWSRAFAVAEIALLLIGWGVAQYPYLMHPDLTLRAAAGPEATVRFLVLSFPLGGLLLAPSLYLLFKVFKAEALRGVQPSGDAAPAGPKSKSAASGTGG